MLTGSFADGATVHGGAEDERISGVFTLLGQEPTKRGEAKAGDTVAFGRLEFDQDRRHAHRREGQVR